MERVVIVRGRLRGRSIELDEQVDELEGEVEVFVRPIAPAVGRSRLLDVIASFPPGSRTKDEIDRQLEDERSGWDRRG